MEFINLRIIDIYLLLTLVAIIMSLVSILSSWSKQRKETKLLTCLFATFGLHMLIIILFNYQWISPRVYGRIAYIFNMSYAPLFVTYWLISQKNDKHWLKYYLATWPILAIALPFLSFKQPFYDSFVIFSYVIGLGLLFGSIKSTFLDKKRRSELSGWYWFYGVFLLVFGGTYIYELTSTVQSFRSVSLMRFIYFTELLSFAIAFLYFNQKSPNLFIRAKLVPIKVNGETQVLASELDLLTKEIEGNQLYLESDLNRNKLHDLTGISPNRISEIINSHFNCNFSNWINRYRIEDAKIKLLEDNGDNSIKEIYYAVGFNTKSSFNKAFKDQTGLTPSQYRNEHLK